MVLSGLLLFILIASAFWTDSISTSVIIEEQEASRRLLSASTTISERCAATVGDWCKSFHDQAPIPWKEAPRGSKTCDDNCNGVGNCNADTGWCDCPAGWTGPDCKTRQNRSCTNTLREGFDKSNEPISHTLPDGRDRDWMDGGDLQSRCAGLCNEDDATCFCMEGKYRRIPAPKGSPPGTPPIQQGRQLITCAPQKDKDGRPLPWGHFVASYEEIYGESGWCNADEPTWRCPCQLDGWTGINCETPAEAFCVNHCSGNGNCMLGFCKCAEGWYGHDCSRRVAGSNAPPLGLLESRPWLAEVAVMPPAALQPPPKPQRVRPLIYVYDMEPLFHSKMLQYRISGAWCIHRQFQQDNSTVIRDWVYNVETMFHENLLQSEHRTFDPEEADFFYAPSYITCMPFPVMAWADWPWFGGPLGPRTYQAAQMALEAKRWVQSKYPYWNRTGGRDHIWTFLHDEGACWAPNELWPSVILTHWGRLDEDHKSATGFQADNYDVEYRTRVNPGGWRKQIAGHPCYDPVKDLVLPMVKPPIHHHQSPLLGAQPRPRNILMFFRGDVGTHRLPNYSRGIRQKLAKLCKKNHWVKEHNIFIGAGNEHEHHSEMMGDYGELLSRSVFCLVAPGDGWSARAEDAVLNGCIPVVVMDDVHPVFGNILDWNSFSIRIPEADIERLPEILKAVPAQRVTEMQDNLSKVWHRFRWSSARVMVSLTRKLEGQIRNFNEGLTHPHHFITAANAEAVKAQMEAVLQLRPHKHPRDLAEDDALATIMQFLHSRIPFTRPEKP